MIFPKNVKKYSSLSDWVYEVLVANPFSLKMCIAIDAYKRPVLDHFCFRHAPFSAAILSKEYITRTTISK